MQSKGAIKFVAVLLLIASLWQLSFTVVSNRQMKIAEEYAVEHAEAATMADEAYAALSAEEKAAQNEKAIRDYKESLDQKVTVTFTLLGHGGENDI
jgi:hypothetical protein